MYILLYHFSYHVILFILGKDKKDSKKKDAGKGKGKKGKKGAKDDSLPKILPVSMGRIFLCN